jgi:HEAT repeat protein
VLAGFIALLAPAAMSSAAPSKDARIKRWLKELSSDDDERRTTGWFQLWAMLQMGDEPIPALMEAMEGKDEFLQWNIAALFGETRRREAVEPLLKLVNTKDRASDNKLGPRVFAMMALGYIQDKRASPDLMAILDSDQRDRARVAAAIALGNLFDTRASEVLAKYTVAKINGRKVDDRVRYACTLSLGNLRMKSNTPLLMKLLADDDEKMQVFATVALGRMRDKTAIPALGDFLKKLSINDKYDIQRIAAVLALGHIGDKSALPFIETELKPSRSWQVRVKAAVARMSIDGVVERKFFEEMVNTHDDLQVATFARICANPKMAMFKPDIRKLMTWKDQAGHLSEEVAAGAMVAVSVLRDKEASEEVIKYLGAGAGVAGCGSSTPWLQSIAAGALRKLEDERAIPALLEIAANPDESIRVQVTHALMPFEDNEKVHKQLVRMLSDPDARVRANAAIALAMQGHRADANLMKRLLDDEYDTVRLNAGIAIEALRNGTRDGRLEWQMDRWTGIKPVDARSELNGLMQSLIGVATETDRGDGGGPTAWEMLSLQMRRLVKPGNEEGKQFRTNRGKNFS